MVKIDTIHDTYQAQVDRYNACNDACIQIVRVMKFQPLKKTTVDIFQQRTDHWFVCELIIFKEI